jgi:hypothetical protein
VIADRMKLEYYHPFLKAAKHPLCGFESSVGWDLSGRGYFGWLRVKNGRSL